MLGSVGLMNARLRLRLLLVPLHGLQTVTPGERGLAAGRWKGDGGGKATAAVGCAELRMASGGRRLLEL